MDIPINFRSKFHRALLRYYFSDPKVAHYVRELSRQLSFSGTYISRELKIFARAGIFIVFGRGKEKYYRLNKKYPLYEELRTIIERIERP